MEMQEVSEVWPSIVSLHLFRQAVRFMSYMLVSPKPTSTSSTSPHVLQLQGLSHLSGKTGAKAAGPYQETSALEV